MSDKDKEPVTLARRFLSFCVAVFGGILLLHFSLQLLSQFWGWLVLLAVLGAVGYALFRILRARRDRW